MSQVPPLFVSVVTWWYWISILRYWLVLGDTGSEQGSTGYQCDMLSENIWFTCCKPSNYPIIGEGKSDYGQTDRQTHRQTDRQTHRQNFLSKTRPLLWKGSSKNDTQKLKLQVSKIHGPPVHARSQERIATFGHRTNDVASPNPRSRLFSFKKQIICFKNLISRPKVEKGSSSATSKQNNKCSTWFGSFFLEQKLARQHSESTRYHVN